MTNVESLLQRVASCTVGHSAVLFFFFCFAMADIPGRSTDI